MNLNEVSSIIKSTRFIDISYNDEIRKIANKYNISFGEADMLLICSMHKEIVNPKDIVCLSKSSKSYVSKYLSILVEKGYINIINDNIDKRKQIITINKKSNKIINDLKKTHNDFINSILKDINNTELNNFINILKKISINLNELERRKIND